jgi:hypothetical protein
MAYFKNNYLLKIRTFILLIVCFFIMKKKLLYKNESIEKNYFLKELNHYIKNYLNRIILKSNISLYIL